MQVQREVRQRPLPRVFSLLCGTPHIRPHHPQKSDYILLFLIDEKRNVDEVASYKIGLENVFIHIGTTEPGTHHNRITFYLPGAVPLSLRFHSDALFDQWKTRLSVLPQYDVNSYEFDHCDVIYRNGIGTCLTLSPLLQHEVPHHRRHQHRPGNGDPESHQDYTEGFRDRARTPSLCTHHLSA